MPHEILPKFNRFHAFVTGVAAVLTLAAAPAPADAYAELRICNDGNVQISAVVAYRQGFRGHVSGWWNADPGRCRTVWTQGAFMQNEVYVGFVRKDSSGQLGAAIYVSKKAKGTMDLKRFCVAMKRFKDSAPRLVDLTADCREGRVLMPFSFMVRLRNVQMTFNVTPDVRKPVIRLGAPARRPAPVDPPPVDRPPQAAQPPAPTAPKASDTGLLRARLLNGLPVISRDGRTWHFEDGKRFGPVDPIASPILLPATDRRPDPALVGLARDALAAMSGRLDCRLRQPGGGDAAVKPPPYSLRADARSNAMDDNGVLVAFEERVENGAVRYRVHRYALHGRLDFAGRRLGREDGCFRLVLPCRGRTTCVLTRMQDARTGAVSYVRGRSIRLLLADAGRLADLSDRMLNAPAPAYAANIVRR